jgi:transcriptional regulator with XRE-family HTH domain
MAIERGLTLRDIAREADVGRSWLAMFHRGEIPNPGYAQIKKLFDFLRSLALRTRRPPLSNRKAA